MTTTMKNDESNIIKAIKQENEKKRKEIKGLQGQIKNLEKSVSDSFKSYVDEKAGGLIGRVFKNEQNEQVTLGVIATALSDLESLAPFKFETFEFPCGDDSQSADDTTGDYHYVEGLKEINDDYGYVEISKKEFLEIYNRFVSRYVLHENNDNDYMNVKKE